MVSPLGPLRDRSGGGNLHGGVRQCELWLEHLEVERGLVEETGVAERIESEFSGLHVGQDWELKVLRYFVVTHNVAN